MKGDLFKRENGKWVVIYSTVGSGFIKEAELYDDSYINVIYGNRKFIPGVNFRLEDEKAIIETVTVEVKNPTPITEGKTLGNTKQSDDNIGRQAPPPPPPKPSNSKFQLNKPLWEEEPFSDNDSFSIQENHVMSHLAYAYNDFASLEQTHPSDIQDFIFHIHALQRIMGQRILRRDYPKVFPTHKQ